MGLAASQGRYLCLTARMSDLVYEGQQISQARMELAKQTQAIADEYNEAMNNTIMQATTPTGGTQQLTYDIITSQDPFSGLCMRIVDLDGNVVVPSKGDYIEVTDKDEEGNEFTLSFTSAEEFINKYMSELSADDKDMLGAFTLPEIKNYYETNYPTSEATLALKNSINPNLKSDDEHYLYDENCKDPKYLQEMLSKGEWLLEQASTSNEDGWDEVVWQGSSAISEIYDTSDDAAAEAKYEAAMKELQRKDKVLELRLEQVETEEKSIESEIDSIKDVIKTNIENSFGTFA